MSIYNEGMSVDKKLPVAVSSRPNGAPSAPTATNKTFVSLLNQCKHGSLACKNKYRSANLERNG